MVARGVPDHGRRQDGPSSTTTQLVDRAKM